MRTIELDPFQAKMVAAATGSTVTALTMTPFDVIKTRLQSQRPAPPPALFPNPPLNTCCQAPGSSSTGCVRRMSSVAARMVEDEVVCIWDNHGGMRTERVNGFWDAGRHVWRAEGLRGLWRGVGTTLIIGVPSSSCYMLTYDHLLHTTLPSISPSPLLTPLLSGILSRTLISTLASPLELIRLNLQSTPPSPNTPHTLRSVLSSIFLLTKSQGIKSLWRGVGPTLWRDVPFSGIYWASYESFKSIFKRRGVEGAQVAFICGAISGTTAALVTQPFDVLKTRRQALVMNPAEVGNSSTNALAKGMTTGKTIGGRTGSIYLVQKILSTEGVSSLFAGITPRIAKIAPACGVMIACFEGVGRFLTHPAVKSVEDMEPDSESQLSFR